MVRSPAAPFRLKINGKYSKKTSPELRAAFLDQPTTLLSETDINTKMLCIFNIFLSSQSSVPCGPANVQANVDCGSGGLTVGWNATRNAQGYMTVISSSNSLKTYNTTQTRLNISALDCGLNYTVNVTSFNQTCVSFPSIVSVKERKSVVVFSFAWCVIPRCCIDNSTLIADVLSWSDLCLAQLHVFPLMWPC